MPKKRLGAEQTVTKLRQVEVLQSQGKSVAAAYKGVGLTEQSYYRYRKEYGGLNVEQARKLRPPAPVTVAPKPIPLDEAPIMQ